MSESRLLSGVTHSEPESGRGLGQCLGKDMAMGQAHPSQRLGWGRTAWCIRMHESSRRHGHRGRSGG